MVFDKLLLDFFESPLNDEVLELIGVIVIEEGRFWAGVVANGMISIPGRFSKFMLVSMDDIDGIGVMLTEGLILVRSDFKIISVSVVVSPSSDII